MRRFAFLAVLAVGAVTLLGLQPASTEVISGTVTATPATIGVGETVDIVLEGTCFSTHTWADAAQNGSTYNVIVTITDPNGDTVFTQTYPGAATIEFPFSDTPTIGTYTVTADCDVDHATCNGETSICGAGTADVIGSYTAGEFTVMEAEAAAADAAPADVVAATPTFTG